MKIIRYSDIEGRVRHAAQQEDGSALDISGDIYSDFEVTDVPAQMQQRCDLHDHAAQHQKRDDGAVREDVEEANTGHG